MPGARPIQDTVALDGDGTCIAQARHRAADFLTRVQAEHGLPVSARAMDLTQLVVSELVTNARKYAPGPVLMELRIVGAVVEVVVWDSDPVLPVARAADAGESDSTVWRSSWLSRMASRSSGSRSESASPPASLCPTIPAGTSPVGAPSSSRSRSRPTPPPFSLTACAGRTPLHR